MPPPVDEPIARRPNTMSHVIFPNGSTASCCDAQLIRAIANVAIEQWMEWDRARRQ